MDATHQVVVIGGGFGGFNVVHRLRKAPVQITLIDRRNFHLFQPLLYQVATGGLSPANIAAPLRDLFRKQVNAEVLLGEVVEIDAAAKKIILRDGALPYDTLVVATGVSHQYFGHDNWEPFAPGLKTIEDATAIRRRVLTAFEEAERETDPARVRAWLTFVIVGGGATGVELAGTLRELACETLRGNFRRINPADAEVILVEATDRVLPTFAPQLSTKALASLEKLGAIVKLNHRVTHVQADGVTVESGSANAVQTEHIATRTVLWAAGVQASPLGKAVAKATGAPLDRAGRVIVQPDCTVPGHPEIFVIGDLANFTGADGKPLPGVAQTAIQQGRYVAKLIRARLRGKCTPPFVYHDRGSLATIGRHAAVADLGWCKLSGWLAWWIWLVIHLMNIVQHQSRILVLIQWGWTYFTRNRAARLITGGDKGADDRQSKQG
ncbi:MAG TPA: NAD(P)/FAD-dependent oxidoreductase [Pirellulales bacterium]|jgi:NADH dehydrogenase|nr:NAD(P)/FAD-dependent oxidoreductase [Pirellulales bacterium]